LKCEKAAAIAIPAGNTAGCGSFFLSRTISCTGEQGVGANRAAGAQSAAFVECNPSKSRRIGILLEKWTKAKAIGKLAHG
jgi:hypothetical protein